MPGSGLCLEYLQAVVGLRSIEIYPNFHFIPLTFLWISGVLIITAVLEIEYRIYFFARIIGR